MTNSTPCDTEVRLDLAAEVLARFGQVRFIAQGSSMIPSIYSGDLVTVRPAALADIHPGDVVLCLREGRFWLHRVTRKWLVGNRLAFVTQGDALPSEDPPADETQLLGRVISVCRRGKSSPLSQAATPWSRLLRASVQNSSAGANILLRLHSFRTRLHDSSAGAFASARHTSAESLR